MSAEEPDPPDPPDPPDAVADLHRRRALVRERMGGAERIERLHARGERTVREHIDGLLDPGSFEEHGTFAHSARTEDAAATPGDGKIGGHGLIAGRPVTVAGDDVTVRRGSSSAVGGKKLRQLSAQALRSGQPFVYFGATGGARIPDSLGSAGFAQVSPGVELFARQRRIPMATVIVGDSFGGSSFFAAASDLVVQLRGTAMAVTSPRVVEVATGEQVTMEALGGAEVHLRRTGQIDLAADTPEEAYTAVRRWLVLLPPNAWTRAERVGGSGGGRGAILGGRGASVAALAPDPALAELVPARRTRAYDMRKVLGRVLDPDTLLELAPDYGRGLLTGLARLDGHSVGVVASQPLQAAGSLDPAACEKAVRLLCLCDAFDLPVVFLQDVPGFFVGAAVEHDGMLKHAIRLQTALALARTPKLTVVLRKAYGLAYFSLGGNDTGVDAVYAWPSAEISFMDPAVAANVVGGGEEVAAALRAETDPYGAAGSLHVDEVIDPADTRPTLARALARLEGRPLAEGWRRPLASWPTC